MSESGEDTHGGPQENGGSGEGSYEVGADERGEGKEGERRWEGLWSRCRRRCGRMVRCGLGDGRRRRSLRGMAIVDTPSMTA